MGRSIIILVMGVSGCGKSTVGKLLGEALKAKGCASAFVEGDDFHPKENRDKMASGMPNKSIKLVNLTNTVKL